jgi:hypothetical protein
LLVTAFPARKHDEETTVDFTVQCLLTLFGYRLPEYDITAALGLLLIVVVFLCLLHSTEAVR